MHAGVHLRPALPARPAAEIRQHPQGVRRQQRGQAAERAPGHAPRGGRQLPGLRGRRPAQGPGLRLPGPDLHPPAPPETAPHGSRRREAGARQFPPDQPAKFASVHRVFGASNVAKLLNEIPAAQRDDAVNSLAYEAEARLNDPVYGCVGFISKLQHRLKQLQLDLHLARQELAKYIGPHALLPTSSDFAAPNYPGNPSASGLLMLPPPQQQQISYPMMGIPTGSGLPVMIRENTQLQQQQQQFHHRLQMQQMYEAAQQQEMLRAYNEQQQQRQFQQQEAIGLMDGGGVTATGFNGVPSASLALGNIGHGTSAYQGQQQAVVELKPQLFLQQQQERSAGSEERGRSTGPSA
ncbi:unnamed protein product [Linum tenue]|uniref:LOB domain-containing protein n=1 Tax=Linum tenue TaxID=586396 RepID=A0AAV0RC45_9ROSI|nr:unnamed protein product [Linum tenue]